MWYHENGLPLSMCSCHTLPPYKGLYTARACCITGQNNTRLRMTDFAFSSWSYGWEYNFFIINSLLLWIICCLVLFKKLLVLWKLSFTLRKHEYKKKAKKVFYAYFENLLLKEIVSIHIYIIFLCCLFFHWWVWWRSIIVTWRHQSKSGRWVGCCAILILVILFRKFVYTYHWRRKARRTSSTSEYFKIMIPSVSET